jgi:hypothetical protein
LKLLLGGGFKTAARGALHSQLLRLREGSSVTTTSKRLSALLLGAGAALLLAGAACAQTTSLTGMWILDAKDFGRDLKMPLTAAAQKMRDDEKKAVEGGDVIGAGGKQCAPEGMPGMMANEFALEFLETPGRVTILNEASTIPRSVYLDETTHPKGLEATWNGHSIGHWEGKTFVIDTVNFNDKANPFGFIGVHSSTTHLVERFHTENDGKNLVGEFTFEDPRLLAKPWTGVVHYKRLPPHSELWEYACEIGGGWQERFQGDPAAKKKG